MVEAMQHQNGSSQTSWWYGPDHFEVGKRRHFGQYEFCLTDIQPSLRLFPWSGLTDLPHLPELEHCIEKWFQGLFPKNEDFGGFVSELNLKSTSSTLQNFPDEIAGITVSDFKR